MTRKTVAQIIGITSISIIVFQWLLTDQISKQKIETKSTTPEVVLSTNDEIELNELVNETYGYKFNYSKNWDTLLVQEKVEITSKTNPAKIIVDATTDITNFQIANESELNSNQKENAQKVLKTIQSTFQIIETTPVTQEEINERYKQTLNGDN